MRGSPAVVMSRKTTLLTPSLVGAAAAPAVHCEMEPLLSAPVYIRDQVHNLLERIKDRISRHISTFRISQKTKHRLKTGPGHSLVLMANSGGYAFYCLADCH